MHYGTPGGPWKVIDEWPDGSIEKQLTNGSSGSACGAAMLREIGVSIAQAKLLQILGDWPNTWEQSRVMNEIAGAEVFTNDRIYGDRVNQIERMSANCPFGAVLVDRVSLLTEHPTIHMVLVDGLNSLGQVIVRDPNQATRYGLDLAEFATYFSGQAVWVK
jgi:filamentous hemagglutinin